jgi:hypothetical protein
MCRSVVHANRTSTQRRNLTPTDGNAELCCEDVPTVLLESAVDACGDTDSPAGNRDSRSLLSGVESDGAILVSAATVFVASHTVAASAFELEGRRAERTAATNRRITAYCFVAQG